VLSNSCFLTGEKRWLESIDDDGNTVVRTINYKAELTKSIAVKCSDMLKHYSPLGSSKLPTVVEYPKQAPNHSVDWDEQEYKAKVVIALGVMTHRFGDAKVLCTTDPKAVFCQTSFKVNQCILVPTTSKVKVVTKGASDAFFSCEGDALAGKVLELMPMCNVDMPVPAWFVPACLEAKDANMKVTMVKVDLDVDVHENPGKGKQKSRGSSAWSIDVPVLVNTRALVEGTELRYYRPAKQGVKRAFDLI